ncbi:hypothetical protein [Alteromonas halophila]|uniref:Uncharacterized protein n=1 Tax=Alteromonas halophila TaxID=516698 RepID=A0A918MZW1_9ALTE|nr:hypothetical protein [Alteromonas halophila]GGW94825.1 hypothetical protein GCM10007391_31320 [Alteromonas halophila]
MEINTSLVTVGNDGNPKKVRPVSEQQQKNAERQAAPVQQELVKAPKSAADFQQASEYQRFVRDVSDNKSQQAISTYTSLARQSQREHVQTLFGVDTYV